MEIHPQNGFSQVFHDTEPMSRLTNDVYAIQFPSSTTTQSDELAASPAEPPNATPADQAFVNLIVLNRVRLNSGHVDSFGAPIGKLHIVVFHKSLSPLIF